METIAAEGNCDDLNSPATRSDAGHQSSTGAGQFVANSSITASPELVHPPILSSNSYSSTAYLSTPAAETSYIATPASQTYSPPSALNSAADSNWTRPDQIPEHLGPSFQHNSGSDICLQAFASPSLQAGRSSKMSTVAIQFDPTFSMGSRSSFTWPGALESNASASPMLGHGFPSMSHTSEPSLTPPQNLRSLTSSPPRYSLTAEQRELKRQQDKARRDTRLVSRMRRTSSQSYAESPPPAVAPIVSNAISLPVYTTASTPVTLMGEPATTMSTSSYLPSYSSPLEDQHGQPASGYSSSYPQNMQPNYNMPMDYAPVYAGQYSTRPTPVPMSQDVGLMYQTPPVMPSAGAVSHEGGHVRVVQSRPKPRCWEHGCNGRQFSTFSNLLRHQREKSGQATKASCPNCGAEFTRTTARNGHLLHDKCKGPRSN